MNKVILIGRLVADNKVSENNGSMTLFNRLAINKKLSKENKSELENNNKPTADFIPIISFGKTAKVINNFTKKGDIIAIEGRLQTSQYLKEDGEISYSINVIVENIELLPQKN